MQSLWQMIACSPKVISAHFKSKHLRYSIPNGRPNEADFKSFQTAINVRFSMLLTKDIVCTIFDVGAHYFASNFASMVVAVGDHLSCTRRFQRFQPACFNQPNQLLKSQGHYPLQEKHLAIFLVIQHYLSQRHSGISATART